MLVFVIEEKFHRTHSWQVPDRQPTTSATSEFIITTSSFFDELAPPPTSCGSDGNSKKAAESCVVCKWSVVACVAVVSSSFVGDCAVSVVVSVVRVGNTFKWKPNNRSEDLAKLVDTRFTALLSSFVTTRTVHTKNRDIPTIHAVTSIPLLAQGPSKASCCPSLDKNGGSLDPRARSGALRRPARGCGGCCSGKRARLITNVWVKRMRRSILMFRVMDNFFGQQCWASCQPTDNWTASTGARWRDVCTFVQHGRRLNYCVQSPTRKLQMSLPTC